MTGNPDQQTQIDILREALTQAQQGLNDWLNLFASGFCDPERVK